MSEKSADLFEVDCYTLGGGIVTSEIYEWDKTLSKWKTCYEKHNTEDFLEEFATFIQGKGFQAKVISGYERYVSVQLENSSVDDFSLKFTELESQLLQQWNDLWSKVVIRPLKELILELLRGDRSFLCKSIAYASQEYGAEDVIRFVQKHNIILD